MPAHAYACNLHNIHAHVAMHVTCKFRVVSNMHVLTMHVQMCLDAVSTLHWPAPVNHHMMANSRYVKYASIAIGLRT